MIAIEVTFLTGRYVATAYNRRTESEWPPHPARLFSALVATHFAGDDALARADERSVLEWLEQQGAPAIAASEASLRDVVTVFVPVNDVALTDVDEEASQLDAARAALAQAQASGDAKAVKQHAAALKKADAAFKKSVASATAVPARPLDPRYGARLLPESRGRQPRAFRSMGIEEPRVTYIWPDAIAAVERQHLLDEMLRRVVRFGHSSSMVSMRLVDRPASPTWRPAAHGDMTLRTVEAGQLAALERAYERHHEVEPRVLPFVSTAYMRETVTGSTEAATSSFSDDWLVLRRVEGPLFPMTAAAGLARATRKALMSHASEPLPEMLSGHTPDRQPSARAHLAVVPLPFVGHQHASGTVLGIALVVPRAASAADRRAVYGAVARWEDTYRQEDEDTPAVQLNLGAAGALRLERVEWGSVQASLRPQSWCGPARAWYSVTPVALDRNPGDLRSRDSDKLAAALAEAIETIARACERIELPRPGHVEILPAAPWAGAAKARHYPPYPGDAGRTQRVLTHVRIEFDRPVKGPVLLGAGRYVGLGLCRPEGTR